MNSPHRTPGELIPLGYMLKFIETDTAFITNLAVSEICSVSSCISEDFYGHIASWPYNGWMLFDDPHRLVATARDLDVNPHSTRLFYYEAYPEEYDEFEETWSRFEPQGESNPDTDYPRLGLRGYDIATYSFGANAECSPLSCNGIAGEVMVNRHCLLDTLDEALALTCSKQLEGVAEGPRRILSVHECPLPSETA